MLIPQKYSPFLLIIEGQPAQKGARVIWFVSNNTENMHRYIQGGYPSLCAYESYVYVVCTDFLMHTGNPETTNVTGNNKRS